MPADDRNQIPVLLLHNIDPDWPAVDIAYARMQAEGAAKALRSVGHPVTSVVVTQSSLTRLLQPYSPDDFVLFNWCEELPGVPRSEALVVTELEAMGFTVSGASSQVLELSYDKAWMRRQLSRRGVPVAEGRVFESLDVAGWDRFPAIVKAAFEHGSIGLTPDSVVENRAQLREQLDRVIQAFGTALVEEFIDGREFRLSVWGKETLVAMPPGEFDFAGFSHLHDRLCTYDAKFTPGSKHYEQITFRVPASLTPSEKRWLERAALDAHRSLGSPDYTRSDLRLRGGIVYVLDVNPNADIASDASMALCAQAAGYSYGAMLSHFVNLAAARHPRFSHWAWSLAPRSPPVSG